MIQSIELCVSDVLFEIEGTAEGIRYGVNFEVAIPEDFLDPKLKLLFVQDYTTNLKGEQTAHSPFPFGWVHEAIRVIELRVNA